MYVMSNSPIPVGDVVNTDWRFRQNQRRYIFQDLGRFEVEIGDSKNMGGLTIMPRYGIKNKKNQFGYKSVPLKGKWRDTNQIFDVVIFQK